MRRMVAAVVALSALAATPPAFAADADVLAVDDPSGVNNRWNPNAVSVQVGDTVTWRFDGTKLAHNVRVSGTTIDTPFAVAGPAASWTFTAMGTYEYVCELHASTMSGTVTVGNPPPPPLSQQPFPNDQSAPAVLELADEDAPRLTGVRAVREGHRAHIRFKLSEPARVTVRLKRGRGAARSKTARLAKGRHAITLRGLRSGTYRVAVFARDAADNRSRVKRDRLTIH